MPYRYPIKSILNILTGRQMDGLLPDNMAPEEGKIANMNVCRENIEEYPCDRLTDLSWDAVIFDGKVIRGEL